MQRLDQQAIRSRLGPAVQSWAAALALGVILFFFSETLFWGRPDRAPVSDLLISWLAYSVLAAAVLYALTIFRVRSLPALVLCGALCDLLTAEAGSFSGNLALWQG